MVGCFAGLPHVAQVVLIDQIFEQTSNFAKVRLGLREFDPDLARSAVARRFGNFGVSVLALSQAAALVHAAGVLCFDKCRGRMFVVRIPQRRRNAVSSLNIEEVIESNGVSTTVLVSVLEPHMLPTVKPKARLAASVDSSGNVSFLCAHGRKRYRVTRTGAVYTSTVTPRNTGRALRAPPLTDMNEQNVGHNRFLRYFPCGAFGPGYILCAKHRREYSSLMVYAYQTVFLDGSRLFASSYTRLDASSGAAVPKLVYHDQSANHASSLRLHSWGHKSTLYESWRLTAVARLGDLLFLRYMMGTRMYSGIVKLPAHCCQIEEVVPYDKDHVMILCLYHAYFFPLYPKDRPEDDDTLRSHAICDQAVTVLAPVTPVNATDLFGTLKSEWLTLDVANAWGPRYVPERRDVRSERLSKIEAAMHPRLVIPGHFQGFCESQGRSMSIFDDALLVNHSDNANA